MTIDYCDDSTRLAATLEAGFYLIDCAVEKAINEHGRLFAEADKQEEASPSKPTPDWLQQMRDRWSAKVSQGVMTALCRQQIAAAQQQQQSLFASLPERFDPLFSLSPARQAGRESQRAHLEDMARGLGGKGA